MTFLDDLARSARGATSVWHQFVVSHDPKRRDWYIFFEGELDNPFYSSHLRALEGANCRIVTFRCDGKRGVLRARADVRGSHRACNRVLFFVDKDLDNLLGAPIACAPDLFCTKTYSIENYLVSSEVLAIVWQQLWLLSEDDPAWPLVRDRFAASMRTFNRIMLPVVAWALLARRRGLKPNLGNLQLAHLLRIVDAIPRFRQGAYETLRRETSCALTPSIREWLGELRPLRKHRAEDVVRGKFQTWMFTRFLETVLQGLAKREGQQPRRSIPPTSDGLALALLGKVQPPVELFAFLQDACRLGQFHTCSDGA